MGANLAERDRPDILILHKVECCSVVTAVQEIPAKRRLFIRRKACHPSGRIHPAAPVGHLLR